MLFFGAPCSHGTEMSRKCKPLTLKEKLDIICKVEEDSKKKHVDLARELDLPVSTLNTIVGKREEIRKKLQVFAAGVKQTRERGPSSLVQGSVSSRRERQ